MFLLRELPIDKLKIDRSFVARITTDRENATIVGALIGLGKALGLKVTAEGVEDEETSEALREMGCQLAQGFLYGAARDLPEFGRASLRAAG